MSTPVKPCAHCGNATFHCLPNMRHVVAYATTVIGMNATREVPGRYWTFTLVVCTQCGLSQTFTTNGPELASLVPGAGTASATTR